VTSGRAGGPSLARRGISAAVTAVAIAAVLLTLLATVLVVWGWIADSRRPRVPDSVVKDISAAIPVLADLQVTNPTSSHYERYLVVRSQGSTLEEQRRSVTETLRSTGWDFDLSTPSLAGKDDVGLLLTDTVELATDDADLASTLNDRLPPNDRGQPLIVLLLTP
jgi:hypothetical protein